MKYLITIVFAVVSTVLMAAHRIDDYHVDTDDKTLISTLVINYSGCKYKPYALVHLRGQTIEKGDIIYDIYHGESTSNCLATVVWEKTGYESYRCSVTPNRRAEAEECWVMTMNREYALSAVTNGLLWSYKAIRNDMFVNVRISEELARELEKEMGY